MQLVEGQLLLNLSNSQTWVQALRTSPRTVHDGVTSVQGHGVLQHLFSDLASLVSGVNQPSVCLHQNGRTQVLLLVPPVGWTRGRTTSTQNTLVQTVQLGSVLNTLQVLSAVSWVVVSLQVWLDGLVLLVEVGQIRNQVTHNVHVWQGVDLGALAGVVVDTAQACQGVDTSNVHGTRATNTLSTRSSEGQGGVLLVLDL